MTLQVIKAEDVRDGEPRLWIERPQDHRDAPSSALHTGSRRDVGCQSCEFAIVDRPAPHSPPMPGTGAPRDPARIDPILARLRAAWHRSPDLRLGQLIVGSIPIGHLDRADAIRRLFNAECHEFGAAGAPVEWPAPSTAAQPPPVLDLDAVERETSGPTSADAIAAHRYAPHLIAEARAAVALRQELAALRAHFDAAAPEHNLPALLDLYNDRTTEARAEIARLTAELADTRTAMELAQSAADRRGAKVDSLTAELAAAHGKIDRLNEWLGANAPSTTPPRTDTGAIAADMLACAEAWAPMHRLIGNVRADEIAAVCRELAGARTVPPDVEAAIDARDAEWQNRIATFHQGFDGDGCESGDPIDWTLSALSQAKCTVEDAVGDFIDGHAKRLCEQAGNAWNRDDEDAEEWASSVHDVLNHLRADEDGTVIDGRASKPATVGGLLATAPVGSIVEWTSGGYWHRATVTDAVADPLLSSRWYMVKSGGMWSRALFTVDGHDLRLPARLVPAHLADADPASRGDLPQKGG